MKFKKISNLIYYLSAVSMLTIGFSTWVFGNTTSGDFFVDVSAEEIKEVDFFTINSKKIKMFSLGPDGLVNDSTIVKNSSIEIPILIDNSSVYKTLGVNEVSFEVILTCSDNNFLTSYIDIPMVSDCISLDSTKNESTVVSDITCNILDTGLTTVITTYPVDDVVNKDGKWMADLYYNQKPTFNVTVRKK